MPLLHLALWEPEIPPNTGNIARLCAATGVPLHLIGRLGFRLDQRSLKRAGVDCWPAALIHRHDTIATFEAAFAGTGRIFCLSAHATLPYTAVQYASGDCLLLGAESRGLPEEVLARYAGRTLVIPMPARAVRSLNLSTAAGIAVYEALRQLHAW